MRTYTQYAARTGEILGVLTLPDRIEEFDRHNVLLLDGATDGATQYIVNGVPTARPVQSSAADKQSIKADGSDTATITGIPVPCAVHIDGPVVMQDIAVPDGSLTFTALVPGAYRIRVEAFPFLPWEVIINAN